MLHHAPPPSHRHRTPPHTTPTPHPKGKSTVSAMFRARGIPIVDADAIVHRLYSTGGAAVAPVAALFPSAVIDGAVSRPALSARVVGDEAAMRRLEAAVHPLVEAERLAVMRGAAAAGARLVVLGGCGV